MNTRAHRVFLGSVKRQKIQLETLLRISQHGDGAYLFLPRDIVDVYQLLPGDRVKVCLVESFRLVSGVEQEEPAQTHEEKIDPVLAVPWQRRRRRKKPELDSGNDFKEPTKKEDESTEELSEEEARNRLDEGEL